MRWPALLLGVLLVSLAAGCKPILLPDDPDPYTGGEVSSLEFSIVGPGVVRISWQENFPDEDGFYVDRRRLNGPWETRILQAYPDQECITDIFAQMGEVYFYRVYAFRGDALSQAAEEQFNFFLPPVCDLEYDFNWDSPTSIRFQWSNPVAWADSIVVAKRWIGQDWMPPVAMLPAITSEWTDPDYDVSHVTEWKFTTYYREHVSAPATITVLSP